MGKVVDLMAYRKMIEDLYKEADQLAENTYVEVLNPTDFVMMTRIDADTVLLGLGTEEFAMGDLMPAITITLPAATLIRLLRRCGHLEEEAK